jgi:hypothetical protein
VKRWFESNALSKFMINGRRMSDVFGDSLHHQTYVKQTKYHGNSDALDSSDQCLRERLSKLMDGSVDGIDRTAYSIVGNAEFADVSFCSNVPSAVESLSSTRTVSSSGYSCGSPSSVPKLATGQARVLRGRSNGSVAEPADAIRLAVKSTSSLSGYPYPSNLPGLNITCWYVMFRFYSSTRCVLQFQIALHDNNIAYDAMNEFANCNAIHVVV